MARNYAALPHDYLEEMELLNDAEFGRLCRALLRYSKDGETTSLSGSERVLFPRVKMQEDRFRKNYEEMVSYRSEAGKKGASARWDNSDSKAQPSIASDGKQWQAMADDSKNGYTETKTETKTETNADTPPTPHGGFERLWEEYPKKVGKKSALAAFNRIRGVSVDTMLATVRRQVHSEQWQKENGRYIPNPTTWLNQGRWEDELTPQKRCADAAVSMPSDDIGRMMEEMGAENTDEH